MFLALTVLTNFERGLCFWTVLTGCVMCIWVVFTALSVLTVLSVLNWGVLDVWTALTALIGFLVVFMIRYVDSVGQIRRD